MKKRIAKKKINKWRACFYRSNYGIYCFYKYSQGHYIICGCRYLLNDILEIGLFTFIYLTNKLGLYINLNFKLKRFTYNFEL